MDLFEHEPRKRKLVILQLTSLIDVFILIIVFLIKGSVVGGTSISFPTNLMAPKSSSKESVEVAPQVLIYGESVEFKMIDQIVAKAEILKPEETDIKAKIRGFIGKYLEGIKSKGTPTDAVTLNVLAEAQTTYSEFFPIIQFLRQCGFETLLFVAESDGPKNEN